MKTAHAMVTDADQRAVGVKFMQPDRDLSHGHVNGSRQCAGGDFPGLPDIEELWRNPVGVGQPLRQFGHLQLLHQKLNVS